MNAIELTNLILARGGAYGKNPSDPEGNALVSLFDPRKGGWEAIFGSLDAVVWEADAFPTDCTGWLVDWSCRKAVETLWTLARGWATSGVRDWYSRTPL